jgi:hypothetical protein
MKMYFPREVKYKQRLNEKEVAKEDMVRLSSFLPSSLVVSPPGEA